MQLPKENAVVVFSNTIDVAKEMVFKPGYVWIIDEMNPSDVTQAIHMSENMMKVLVAPTAPGSIRCRNADLMLPAGVPRIFTGNAESAQQWSGLRLKWSEPLQRKTIVYNITKPLCDAQWRAGEADENDDSAMQVASALREGPCRIFVEPPAGPSLAGRMLNVMRVLFGASLRLPQFNCLSLLC